MSAQTGKPVFYQWQKEHGFPVFLRLERSLMEGRLQKLVADLGFSEVPEADHKKIPLARASTRVLSVSPASARVADQVATPDSLDRFGLETLHPHGAAQVYLRRHIGMMVFSPSSTVWELGLASKLETTEDLMGLRVMFNRYLSWALAGRDVIGFWGVVTGDGFVVMRQGQSFGEAVFVDMANRRVFHSAGSRPMDGVFTIMRADSTAQPGKPLHREELVSFLSTHTTYFSLTGLPANLRRAALALGALARGEWGGLPSHDGLSNG